MANAKIIGTGSYTPSIKKKNSDFSDHIFFNAQGVPFSSPSEVIIEKFKSITGIEERKYASTDLHMSDLAFFAAEKAIENANISPETLDYIIVAHNFGNVTRLGAPSDILPSIAARVKHRLQIENPNTVAYDLIFGCPGWIEGLIQGQAFIKAGMAKRVLVVGAETLSRVIDKGDRDSMIFSDGAGACVLEKTEDETMGIRSHATQTFAKEEVYYLSFGKPNDPKADNTKSYIKMQGRKIYEFSLNHVPQAMKKALEESGVAIEKIRKVFIHQANEKMDEAIVKRFYKLFKQQVPERIMPMNIHTFGNSSVATIPTLLDMVLKGHIENHQVKKGDAVIFASVGAGMNINAIVYQF